MNDDAEGHVQLHSRVVRIGHWFSVIAILILAGGVVAAHGVLRTGTIETATIPNVQAQVVRIDARLEALAFEIQHTVSEGVLAEVAMLRAEVCALAGQNQCMSITPRPPHRSSPKAKRLR